MIPAVGEVDEVERLGNVLTAAIDRFHNRFQMIHEDLEISIDENVHNDDLNEGGRDQPQFQSGLEYDDEDEEEEDDDDDEDDIDDEDILGLYNDELYQSPNNRHPVDADLFYNDRRNTTDDDKDDKDDTNDHIRNVDKDYHYVRIIQPNPSRNQSSIRRRRSSSSSTSGKYPINSQNAYHNWERHSPSTIVSTTDQSDSSPRFPDQFNSFDPFSLLINNSLLSQQFKDSLHLKSIGTESLFQIQSLKTYKNNLSTIIRNPHTNEDYLIIGYNSDILVYDFNSTTNLPYKIPLFKFDTKPPFTTTTDRLISTWPYFPHTVNFITKFDDFIGSQGIVCVCCDDGILYIYDIESIITKANEFKLKRPQQFQDPATIPSNKIHFKPRFKVRLDASIWGLDFKHYNGSYNVFIISDNSQSLTLLYYDEFDQRFYNVKSHQLLHNIPECSIISVNINHDTGTHDVKVSCGSISGELIIFQFKFKLIHGPVNIHEWEFYKDQEYHYVDKAIEQLENRNNINFNNANIINISSSKFNRVKFNNPTVIVRTVLNEYCWTTKVINSKYFKLVNSINELTGDFTINSNEKCFDIINESKILNLEFDPVKSSHLGLASNWQHFECKTINLSKLSHSTMTLPPSSPHSHTLDSSILATLDDEYKRIHKGVLSQYTHMKGRPLQKSINKKSYLLDVSQDLQSFDMLVVSTGKKLGLFRTDTLFCSCSTKTMFDLSIPSNDQSKPANRISITQIIPQLQCVVAISQLGLVSIMRLCQYRGLYAMRQEFVFPNAFILAFSNYGGHRTIAGFSIRDKSSSPQYPRFLLYIIYTDGFILTYELSLNDNNDDLLVNCL
ncbi:CRT10-domain-containing protein [Scheffersomyces coipomensis]|uniref:CRT10-domain-containing protein n=1 Tax=Scheffersomyces coipomensis TaxID=1788519 RepID=UPI00315CCE7D